MAKRGDYTKEERVVYEQNLPRIEKIRNRAATVLKVATADYQAGDIRKPVFESIKNDLVLAERAVYELKFTLADGNIDVAKMRLEHARQKS